MKRLRTFQTTSVDDEHEATAILKILKAHTPTSVVEEALQGGNMYRDRDNLDVLCEDLAVALAKFNPYQRKAVFEEALLKWDLETRRKLSCSASSQGLWVKMESFALKDLLMRSTKKSSQPTQVHQGWQTAWPEHKYGGECVARQSCPGTTCRTTFDNSGGVTSEDPLGGEAKEAPEEKEQRA